MKRFLSIFMLLSVFFTFNINTHEVEAAVKCKTIYIGYGNHKTIVCEGIDYTFFNEYISKHEIPTLAWQSGASVKRKGDGVKECRTSRMGYMVKADIRVNGNGAKYYQGPSCYVDTY